MNTIHVERDILTEQVLDATTLPEITAVFRMRFKTGSKRILKTAECVMLSSSFTCWKKSR